MVLAGPDVERNKVVRWRCVADAALWKRQSVDTNK
jgi:hypothetical protein